MDETNALEVALAIGFSFGMLVSAVVLSCIVSRQADRNRRQADRIQRLGDQLDQERKR